MKTSIQIICLTCFFITTLLMSACSSVQMKKYYHEPEAKISDYKTFYFADVHGKSEIPMEYQFRVDIIKEELVKFMEGLGLKQAGDDADLLINVGVVVEEKVQTYETNFRDAQYRYMGQRNYSWSSETVEVERYHEGTVTMDWVDRAKSKMMWHFVLSSVLAKKNEEARKNIETGKDLILKKLNSKK